MTIKMFLQGKSASSDRELFGMVGKFIVDATLHEKLGTAITSQDGDIWLVSITGKGEVRGFSTSRKLNAGLHIRFVHCPNDSPLMCKTMISGLLKLAESDGCKCVWTNDKPDNEFWPEFGFKFTPRARGIFGRWERKVA